MADGNAKTPGSAEATMTPERRARLRRRRVRNALRVVPECLSVILLWLLIPALPHRAMLALAWLCGRVASLPFFAQTKAIDLNLRFIYGDRKTAEERRRLVREVNGNAVRMFLEYFWYSWFTTRRVRRHVAIDESIRPVLESPEGVLLVSGHLGNWEVGALRSSVEGIPLTSVYAPIGHPVTQWLMRRMRSHTGGHIVPREGAAVALLRTLRDGGKIALLLDQYIPVRQGGMFSKILGRPAIVSGLVGLLSARRRAPVASAGCVHVGGGNYVFKLFRMLPGDHGMTPEQVTHWVADSITRQIEEYPGQWFWMYRRWRHVPPGEDPADYPPYAVTYKEGRD